MKDFDGWNEIKKEIHSNGENKFYQPRDIWWCSMGLNVGTESDGKGREYKRPIVAIKGFNKESFLGIALTGRKLEGKYYLFLGKVEDREASANLSQIRIFDTKRLVKKIGKLERNKFDELIDRIIKLIK